MITAKDWQRYNNLGVLDIFEIDPGFTASPTEWDKNVLEATYKREGTFYRRTLTLEADPNRGGITAWSYLGPDLELL